MEAQRERDLMDTFLATVDAAIVVLDPGGKILRFNRRSEELIGEEDLRRCRSVVDRLIDG
ncbi:MAG: hypothetical protein D5R96_03345 [Methanocalculus sp. MSAO_Arc2]|uniref:PAS domain-containing protein n=1 Tax=Methanocalculus sp. MSAO_Arc2 TaxID=2293855 RepID=UPI000FED691D|nr:MAG: hypothetical protein D5R96_03345 [Methanocalculus sp. MSAO_Arc2]